MAWTFWGSNTGGGHWASYAVSTGSPSRNKAARPWHWPPHSHLALSLRMDKIVRLLPTVPSMVCYGVTFYTVYIISGVCIGTIGRGTALQAGRSWVWFPMVPLEFFIWHNPSGHTVALGSTQPLREMRTRNISWEVKATGATADKLTTFMCRLSWNLEVWTSWNPQGMSRPVMGLLYRYSTECNK